jgi:two-component system heavy metal sensor histidine kinase CusS
VTRSLRLRLTLGVLCVLAVVLATFAIVVRVVLRHALDRQLDARLTANAAAVAGMAEDGTPPEFEYEALPEFERSVRPGFFEAWLDDGRVLARSPSLGARDLNRRGVRPEASVFADVMLPDGRPGRTVELRRPLRIEDAPPGAPPSGRFVTVVVGQGTEDVHETLAAMSRWLWALGLLALALGSAATVLAVTRGLRSVRELAAEIATRHENDLARALPRNGPVELAPVVDKLTELFQRLSASFERERRFTADVSHELRTPLAALLTILEVAASRDRDAAAYRRALADAKAIVDQTQALVQNLLMLARVDARQIDVANQELRLRPFVDDCWRAFAAQAAHRRLTFSNDVGPAAAVMTDAEKFRIVLTNLLANAAAYTADGGAIHVREGRGDVVLEVVDTGPPIPEDVLPRIFDRFTRADTARSAVGVHSGVGLALVQAICEVLDLSISAENASDGSVLFRLRSRPAGARAVGRGVTRLGR